MTTAAAIAEAATLIRQRSNHAEAAYEAMIRTLASGGDELPETIVETIEAAGRTHDELLADVARIEAKLAVKATADTLPDLQAKLTTAEAQLESLNKELAEAKASYFRRIATLEETLVPLRLQTAAAYEAGQKLARGEFDSLALKQAKAKLAKRMSALRNQASPLEDELQRGERRLAGYDDGLLKAKNDADGRYLREQAAGLRRTLDSIRGQLRPLHAESERCLAELAVLDGESV